MFGGLDLKGGKDNAVSKQEPPPAPSAASSSFSFLNNLAPTATVENPSAPPPTSAFSFLYSSTNATLTTTAGVDTKAPAPSISAFSFLGASSSAPPAAETASAPASSSFSFLNNSNSTNTTGLSAAVEGDSGLHLPESSSSGGGFAFISNAASSMDSKEPASIPAPTGSGDSFGLDLLSSSNSMQHPNSSQPVGSGVVFGRAAAVPAPVKKRAPRTRVGVGAGAAASPPMNHLTPAQQLQQQQQRPPAVRDAAVEASQRAESFIHQKMKQQSLEMVKSMEQERHPPPSIVVSREHDNGSALASIRSTDSDDILAEATAAAEEAKRQQLKLQQQQQGRTASFGAGLTGLFRARSATKADSGGGHNHGSSLSNLSNASSSHEGSRPPSLHGSELVIPVSAANERLSKDDESKRGGMTERQHIPVETETSISTGGYESGSSLLAKATTEAFTLTSTSTAAQPPLTFKPSTTTTTAPVQTFKLSVPQPPKQKTATEVFQKTMLDFRAKVVHSMEEVTRLRHQRIGLLEERFVTLAKERLAVQQKQQALQQQIAAAEAEDFELADRLTTVMAAHERERVEYEAVVENIGRAIQQLDAQKHTVIHAVSNCFQDIQKTLKAFLKEQHSHDSHDVLDTLKQLERISKQISAEQDRLEQDLKHIERDEKLVEEEAKELEGAIAEQSTQFEQHKQEAQHKLQIVEDEIEELRKQLQAKQAVAAGLRTEIAGHEEAVFKVRVKFSRQIDRVQKKKSTIRDNREEWEVEKTGNERLRQEHEEKVKAHSEALLVRDQLLDALNKEIEMADTFESIVAKEMVFGVDEEEELDDELAQLQAEVVKCEAALTESKEVYKAATTILNNLKAEVEDLEFRIPHLEELKKAAASQRDFKTAGKASKEAKEACSRLKECQDEIEGEASAKVAMAEEVVKKLEVELEKARKIAREKEKESALASMQRLADNIKRLTATKESVCANADPYSVKGVGAFVLDGQIKALLMEGQTYGDKYGGWDELIAGCVTVQGDDTSKNLPLESKDDEVKGSEVVLDANKRLTTEENGNHAVGDAQASDETAHLPESTDTKGLKEETLRKFRDATKRLQEVEVAIESAVSSEDFDKAAELDETLQQLLAEVHSLNLTDEEMHLALSGEDNSTGIVQEPETKKDTEATDHSDVIGSAELRTEGSSEDGVLEVSNVEQEAQVPPDAEESEPISNNHEMPRSDSHVEIGTEVSAVEDKNGDVVSVNGEPATNEQEKEENESI